VFVIRGSTLASTNTTQVQQPYRKVRILKRELQKGTRKIDIIAEMTKGRRQGKRKHVQYPPNIHMKNWQLMNNHIDG
jgi:hypothetical protein